MQHRPFKSGITQLEPLLLETQLQWQKYYSDKIIYSGRNHLLQEFRFPHTHTHTHTHTDTHRHTQTHRHILERPRLILSWGGCNSSMLLFTHYLQTHVCIPYSCTRIRIQIAHTYLNGYHNSVITPFRLSAFISVVISCCWPTLHHHSLFIHNSNTRTRCHSLVTRSIYTR